MSTRAPATLPDVLARIANAGPYRIKLRMVNLIHTSEGSRGGRFFMKVEP
jgi:hypothetical protein